MTPGKVEEPRPKPGQVGEHRRSYLHQPALKRKLDDRSQAPVAGLQQPLLFVGLEPTLPPRRRLRSAHPLCRVVQPFRPPLGAGNRVKVR